MCFLLPNCKKKKLDSPPYPPNGNYFLVNEERLNLLNNKLLVVYKLDNLGNIVSSKNITEVIDLTGKTYFRLSTSWSETISMFSQGVNHFKFAYGNKFSDDVFITAIINAETNTIVFDNVLYNQNKIEPLVSEIPVTNSKIYIVR